MPNWEAKEARAKSSSLSGRRRVWPPPSLKEPANAAHRTPQHWHAKSWPATYWLCTVLFLGMLATARPVYAQQGDALGTGTLYLQKASERVEAPRVHSAIDMVVSGTIAQVKVRQHFHNPGDEWVEGTYAFPLPENSAVNRLHMQVGERVIVGEIREKAQAQQLFQQAKANGQRASVVHQQRPNIFRTAVANIGPGETIVITIAYLQIVDHEAGRYSVRFPLTITPRYIPGASASGDAPSAETPVLMLSPLAHDMHDVATLGDLQPALAAANASRQSVSFDISLDAGVAIEQIKSSYHAVTTALERGKYRVRLASETIAPDRDFELSWIPVVHGGPAATLFREHTESGEHVLLMFMPPQERGEATANREVIFIIDTSGSMAGTSIEQAREALLSGLATLTTKDRFNLIQFNSYHESLFEAPVEASHANLARARSYVLGLRANGGTEMLPALSAAFGMARSAEHLRQILFITDGAVSNEIELMRTIKERIDDARLFTVGIGSAPNGYFMRTAAQTGRGTFTFIGSAEQVEERMGELFRKLTSPVLTNISIDWPTGITPEYAPAQIGDLYADEPIVVSARLPGKATGMLTISGMSNGAWTRQIGLDAAESRAGVSTLWARNRVADLMNLQASYVSDNDIRAQILPLALEYELVTKYTSLVAIDTTPVRRPDETLNSTRIENTTPAGQQWDAAALPRTATSSQLQLLIGVLALLFALALQVRSLNRREKRS